jgi:hypothetical protein
MREAWGYLTTLLAALAILGGGAPPAWAGAHAAISPGFAVDTREAVAKPTGHAPTW